MMERMETASDHTVTGFVRADGTRLVNGAGQEILLRGVGLGNWLLPEGYMWKFPEEGDRPRKIERMVEHLIGPDKAADFWALYWERYTTEADIKQIAAEGFNSIRLPINARFLLEDEEEPLRIQNDRLAYIDRLIEWCKKHRLYIILDLHGAPGGQTGAIIDDSARNLPELFTEEKNRRLTIELWRLLAERYKDEWIVAGYDLLNEPLPDWFSAYNDQLMPLYKELIAAIREVDSRHMIILEGAHWATDWSIFTEKTDDNLMLQFHKYWSNPDTESLQAYLHKREEWKVPIFMGEGGENNDDWYVGAFQLLEDHCISWNFWPWKKMDTGNSPCSITMPADWSKLVRYLEGGEQPDTAVAEQILWEFLDNIQFERCTYQAHVVRALFRRAPLRIPAIFYGNQGEGVSFGRTAKTENQLGFRVQDGTGIGFEEGGEPRHNYWHGRGQSEQRVFVQLEPGDWLAYQFTVVRSGEHRLRIKLFPVEESVTAAITANGKHIGNIMASDVGKWQTAELVLHNLAPGQVKLIIQAEVQPLKLEWVEMI
ncbi:hypothetical protein J40TS1_16700 [Paenibacillus montaniterrae]|uniref:Glycoside hydrolase family 5 domain-containing protein n=1 Tax=Paenibacillus montaniterrae TaxID=429341 RepID=A0A920CY62_9BACL|nr:cellulase family glycosylhydrolase [Paenibacillus montaniterrae]GIP16028.1 hypothetical protein J40TS1_16700 [Paenibacillus montaniterrae]